MTVLQKSSVRRAQHFLKLRFVHVALVNEFECHFPNNRMSVNRLFFVFANTQNRSSIKDISNDKLIRLRPGCLYFIPCKYLIDIDITPDLSFISLQFNLDIFYGFDLLESHPRCEIIENNDIVSKAKNLFTEDKSLETLYFLNETVFNICGRWAADAESDISERLAQSQKYDFILNYIQNECNAATTVEMLADMSGMRKDVFSRTFSKDIGVSPKNFIASVLVRKASELLLTPEILIKEVSEQLSFSSEYYFSYFFKKHTGLSPQAYQIQNK